MDPPTINVPPSVDSAQPQDAARGGPSEDVELIAKVKEGIDASLLEEMEDSARQCGENLSHLMGSLQSSLHAVSSCA